MKTFNDFKKTPEALNEASKVNQDLAKEREKQAKIKDAIADIDEQIAKNEVANGITQLSKDTKKSTLTAEKGKLTMSLGQSMTREATFMTAAAKAKSEKSSS